MPDTQVHIEHVNWGSAVFSAETDPPLREALESLCYGSRPQSLILLTMPATNPSRHSEAPQIVGCEGAVLMRSFSSLLALKRGIIFWGTFTGRAGFWIAAPLRSARARVEASKLAQFHRIAGPQRSHNAVKNLLDNDRGVLSGDLYHPGNFLNQVSLGHTAALFLLGCGRGRTPLMLG